MGTEFLPPCPFWVSFLHPPFKPDPKKGKICSAPRQRLRSRIPKAHLIRVYVSASRSANGWRVGKRGKRQRSEWRVSGGQRPLSGCRMIDGDQVLCVWPPPGFPHPRIGVFT